MRRGEIAAAIPTHYANLVYLDNANRRGCSIFFRYAARCQSSVEKVAIAGELAHRIHYLPLSTGKRGFAKVLNILSLI